MKRPIGLATLLALAVVLVAPVRAADGPSELEITASKAATMTAAEWRAFSKNLVNALGSDNLGLQVSAMRMVIQYPTQVNVEDAIFDIVRLYRDSHDTRVRLMAVAALAKMQHGWGMDFLKRSEAFEKDPRIKRVIHAALVAYYNGRQETALFAAQGGR